MEKNSRHYNKVSKEELIQRIKELEEVNSQLRKDKNENELLSFPWIGNLGLWHWMVQSDELIFNEKKATNLGYSREEIPEEVGFEYFTSKLHPEDYDRVMDNMRQHLLNKTNAFDLEYRIQTKDGHYVWYYDRGKVMKRTKEGKPLVVSGIVFDVSKNKNMENELREANEKLKQLVITDELTGAFNKRFMNEKINSEIQLYDRTNTSFSLIMLDVDNFKLVNDNFGHNVGDLVLKKVVETVKKRIRKIDILSRWGGDEFIILLPDTQMPHAIVLAEDLKAAFDRIMIDEVGKVTSSIGVSTYTKGDTIDTLIKKVDDLMYHSKSKGKGSISYE